MNPKTDQDYIIRLKAKQTNALLYKEKIHLDAEISKLEYYIQAEDFGASSDAGSVISMNKTRLTNEGNAVISNSINEAIKLVDGNKPNYKCDDKDLINLEQELTKTIKTLEEALAKKSCDQVLDLIKTRNIENMGKKVQLAIQKEPAIDTKPYAPCTVYDDFISKANQYYEEYKLENKD